MAEPDELDYGRYCQHGYNIGTPGGSDFLCHYCEMGQTVPAVATRWHVYLGEVEVDSAGEPIRMPHLTTLNTLHTKQAALKSYAYWIDMCVKYGWRTREGNWLLICWRQDDYTAWINPEEWEDQ